MPSPITTASAAATASISGQVFAQATSAPLPDEQIDLFDSNCNYLQLVAPASLDAQSDFSFSGLAAGSYKIEYTYWGTTVNVLSPYFGNGASCSNAPVIQLASGQALSLGQVTLPLGASISGVVTGPTGTAAYGGTVDLFDSTGAQLKQTSTDVYTGQYSFIGLYPGAYRLKFSGGYLNSLAPQYWNGKDSLADATVITLASAQIDNGISVQLQTGPSISGAVDIDTGSGPYPAQGDIQVDLFDASGTYVESTIVDAGTYQLFGMAPGSYTVRFEEPWGYSSNIGLASTWYGGAQFEDQSTPVVVGSGQVTGINNTLYLGGSITGTISSNVLEPPNYFYSSQLEAEAFAWDSVSSKWALVGLVTQISSGGTYTIPALPPNSYKVEFLDGTPHSTGQSTWWQNAATETAATPVAVASGATVSSINGNVPQGPRNILGGIVETDSGLPVAGVAVLAEQFDPLTGADLGTLQTTTQSNGTYQFLYIPDGDYTVEFISPSSQYVFQAFDDESIYFYPDLITLQGGVGIYNINAHLHLPATLSGTVSAPGGTAADFAANDVTVELEVLDGPTNTWQETGDFYPVSLSGGAYRYSIPGLAPDNYRLLFQYSGPAITGQFTSPTIALAAGTSLTYNATIPLTAPATMGSIDTLSGSRAGIAVAGWAAYPSAPTAPVTVALNIGASWFSVPTGLANAEAPLHVAGAGSNQGFAGTFVEPPGTYSACIWVTQLVGPSTKLGCSTVTVPAATPTTFGLDTLAGSTAGVAVAGWAQFPDAPSSAVNVAVNIGAGWYGFTANQANSDAGAGTNHGYSGTIPLAPGTYSACVWVSEPTGGAVNTGCHTVVVPARPATTYGLDSLTGVVGGVSVAGWAQFPDAPSAAVNVAVNIGAGWYGFTANQANTDAGAGTSHGYAGTIPLPPGTYSACVWVSEPSGGAVNTGCHTVVVPARPATTYGLDSLSGSTAGVSVAGWAQFPDAPSTAVNVAVNIGAGWYGFTANQANTDAGAGTNHGYAGTIPLPPGTYSACVWVSEPSGGAVNTGCHTVVVPTVPPAVTSFDTATAVTGGIQVTGTSQFPSSPGISVGVAAQIGASWFGFTANGTGHSFTGLIPETHGTYTVCMWTTQPTGPATQFGCKVVAVP